MSWDSCFAFPALVVAVGFPVQPPPLLPAVTYPSTYFLSTEEAHEASLTSFDSRFCVLTGLWAGHRTEQHDRRRHRVRAHRRRLRVAAAVFGGDDRPAAGQHHSACRGAGPGFVAVLVMPARTACGYQRCAEDAARRPAILQHEWYGAATLSLAAVPYRQAHSLERRSSSTMSCRAKRCRASRPSLPRSPRCLPATPSR